MKNYVSVLFCENCHHSAKVEASTFNETLMFKLEDKSCFEILKSSLTANRLFCKCLACNSCEVVSIDGYIFDHILELNKLGYITEYSCEGHRPNENSYIKFSNIPADKRKNFVDAYTLVSNKPEFKDIMNMISYSYYDFDYTNEVFINVDLGEDGSSLLVDFMYIRGASETSPNYEKCKELFWKFIREIIYTLKSIN